jgi:hypothetical protein
VRQKTGGMVHDEATGDRVPPQVYGLSLDSQQCAVIGNVAWECRRECLARLKILGDDEEADVMMRAHSYSVPYKTGYSWCCSSRLVSCAESETTVIQRGETS